MTVIPPVLSAMEYRQAEAWYQGEQSTRAANAMARALLVGHGVEANPGFAVELLRAGSGDGETSSMLDLARAYANGQGVPLDYEAARAWLTKGAEAGDHRAMADLIVLLCSGVFRSVDDDPALRCEVLGWSLRLLALDPNWTDHLRSTLPMLIDEMTPEQVEAGFRQHGRATYH